MIWRVEMGPLRKRSSGCDSGFTLTEILVVVAILGILVALVPLVNVGLQTARLNADTRMLLADLDEAHGAAIDADTETEIVIDTDALRYSSSLGPKAQFSRATLQLDVTTPTEDTAGAVHHIHFFPDGSSSGGFIKIKGTNTSRAIETSWLTGHSNNVDAP
jgi:general secretion pathway protein H